MWFSQAPPCQISANPFAALRRVHVFACFFKWLSFEYLFCAYSTGFLQPAQFVKWLKVSLGEELVRLSKCTWGPVHSPSWTDSWDWAAERSSRSRERLECSRCIENVLNLDEIVYDLLRIWLYNGENTRENKSGLIDLNQLRFYETSHKSVFQPSYLPPMHSIRVPRQMGELREISKAQLALKRLCIILLVKWCHMWRSSKYQHLFNLHKQLSQ